MSDMTNEPTGAGPDDLTPVEPSVAPTEPMPTAEYAAAPAVEPVYATVPPAAPATAVAATPSDHVSISKKWLLIGGGAIVAVILLGGTFAAGATVGRHAGSRFDGRGPAVMGQFEGGGMQPGGQGQFRGDGGGYHQRGGRGGMRGWGQEQGLQQQGVPNTQQAPSAIPTP
jgi:hypothetical protein